MSLPVRSLHNKRLAFYRRHCTQRGVEYSSMVKFLGSVCESLRTKPELRRPRGRPSNNDLDDETPSPRRYRMSLRPTEDMRTDRSQPHYPGHTDRGRCRFCPYGHTTLMCQSCKVRLCLTKERNCFVQYHEKL